MFQVLMGKENEMIDVIFSTNFHQKLFIYELFSSTDCSLMFLLNFRISPGDTSSWFSLTMRKQKWKFQSARINKKNAWDENHLKPLG